MDLNVVIPTTPSKIDWFRKTAQGLFMQDIPIHLIVVVDLKPWDKFDENYYEVADEVIVLEGRSKLKRQHEAINMVLKNLDQDEIVILLDDDYLLGCTDFLERMIAICTPGIIVTPSSFDEVEENALSITRDRLCKDPNNHNIITWFDEDVPRINLSCVAEKRGQHPMCGHPKAFFPRDFFAVGGLKYDEFPHYWWCDTDLFYRMKEAYEFKHLELPCIHVNHPRYNPSLFAKSNAKRFIDKRNENEKIEPKHLEAAERQKSL